MSLLAEERRFRISEILSRERSVTAADLIRMLGVTAATIRRDLAALEKEGVLVRSHGGAVSRTSSTNFQPSYEALGRSNRAEKQAIAREAERLILDGETVFLEGSTHGLRISAAAAPSKPPDGDHKFSADRRTVSAQPACLCDFNGRRITKGCLLSFWRLGAACTLGNSR